MTRGDSDHRVGATHDPETNTYHAKYQPDEPESLSTAVVYLVSVATGEEPETIDPLYEVADTDALEKLFQSKEMAGEIEFEYYGCEVTVVSDGEIFVTPIEDDD